MVWTCGDGQKIHFEFTWGILCHASGLCSVKKFLWIKNSFDDCATATTVACKGNCMRQFGMGHFIRLKQVEKHGFSVYYKFWRLFGRFTDSFAFQCGTYNAVYDQNNNSHVVHMFLVFLIPFIFNSSAVLVYGFGCREKQKFSFCLFLCTRFTNIDDECSTSEARGEEECSHNKNRIKFSQSACAQ